MTRTPIDPSYGYTLEDLLKLVPPTPVADFADFWRMRRQRVSGLQPNPRLTQSALALSGWTVHDLEYESTDGVSIGGWLLVPESGLVRRAMVVGHGYGGCPAPEDTIPASECAVLYPCLRGIGRSPLPGVSSNPNYHVLHDIQDRHRYLLGGCVDDVWMAVSVLQELFPQVAGHVGYMGTSFGGGIGALAAPWDERIVRLHLALPTFGHQALRLTLPCTGCGEALRHHYLCNALNIVDTLAYYDAACAASFLKVPVHVAAARRDSAVPPPGQFAIYNAAPKALRHLFVLDEGHASYPAQASQEDALFKELEGFFAET
jgi:cephalosporin-C deacetylase